MENEIEIPDWVISDTHWRHKNINVFSQRCTPAYPSPKAVDDLMVYNWMNLVKPHHTILHLGDLGFFKQGDDTQFLKDLPGNKLFVRGNHDKGLSPEWLADHGFIEIASPYTVFDGVEVIFSHYPQPLRKGQANVHGHQHNNPRANTMSHIDLSVELWHYAPVSCRHAVEKVVWSSKTNSKDAGPRTVKYRGK